MPATKSDNTLGIYAHWLTQNYRWVMTIVLLCLAFLSSGVRFLTFDSDWQIYFKEDDPQRIAYEELEETYSRSTDALFVLTPASGGVFSRDFLKAIEALTDAAWQLPYSQRVNSLTNFQYTYAEGDDLIVEDLFSEVDRLSDAQLLKRRAVALNEKRLLARVVAADARSTAVQVTFQLPEVDDAEGQIAAAAVASLGQRIEQEFSPITVHLTGELMMDNAFLDAATSDIKTLTPLMYLGIVLVVFLILRSFMATLAVIILVTTSVIGSLGFAGWAGIPITNTLVAVPTIIMTLALADSIHIIVSLLSSLEKGHSKREALAESLQLNFHPVLVTSVTTAIGFLTLNFVDVPPFQDFGIVAAFGVMLALLLSITLLPCLLAMLPITSRTSEHGGFMILSSGMNKLAQYIIVKRRFLLSVSVLLTVGLLMAIPLNEANNQFIKFFDQKIEFRLASDYTTENLTGIYHVYYSIPAAESHGVTTPEFLTKLTHFSEWLRQQPEVMHVSTLSDTIKKLNQNLNFDREDAYALPDSRELAAQYLLLYEMSLPYGLDLNNQINMDKSATLVEVALGDITTNEIDRFKERSETWLRENAPEMFTYVVGSSVMFSDVYKRSTQTMMVGALVGLILISMLLIFVLRSLKHGLISLLTNLLPVGLAFGLWGLLVGQVNMGVALVITMTLGIVVDDTVHLLSKYLHGLRVMGLNSGDAIRYAFSTAGFALIVTTAALATGFFIMSLSTFSLNSYSSLLTSVTLIFALYVDLIMLPAVLTLFDKSDGEIGAGKT